MIKLPDLTDHPRRFWIALAGAVTLGVALRLMLIIASGWRIDYDEAMIGLLGLRVLRGQWMAFIPAQPTLGAIEPYLLAPLFITLFGASPLTLRLLSLMLAAAYILTTAEVGRAAFCQRVGALAGLLAAVTPPYMMIASLKTWGATIETIILGNLLFIAAGYVIAPARTHQQRGIGLAAIGLIAGVMFWIAWLGSYYLIPAGVIILWRGRGVLFRGWWAALIGFALGSLPFWTYNFTHDWTTFHAVLGGQALTGAERGAVLAHAWEDLLPRLVSGDPAWRVSGPRGLTLLMIVYYLSLLALPVWAMRSDGSPPGRVSVRWMLAFFIVTLPAIYLASGYSRNALNPWGLDATGRYVVMLHTALPVGAAALAVRHWRNVLARILPPVAVSGVLALNLLGIFRLDPVIAFNSPYYDRLPTTLDPLIAYLDEQGINRVWTDVGIAHVLMFETGERIIAADYYDARIAGGLVRFPDALTAVESAQRVAFVVVVTPGQQNPPIQQALDAVGIPYSQARISPTLAVYIPTERIDPAQIAVGLGYQYWISPTP